MSRTARLRAQADSAIEQQQRAQDKRERGELEWLADDPDCPDVMRLAALAEELGEVARAIHDHDRDNLKTELAQLAGIALAWGAALQ